MSAPDIWVADYINPICSVCGSSDHLRDVHGVIPDLTEAEACDVMAIHAERGGVCAVCAVPWPCKRWVSAREAWDAAQSP